MKIFFLSLIILFFASLSGEAQNNIEKIEKEITKTQNSIKIVEKKSSESLIKLKLISTEIALHKRLLNSLKNEIKNIDKEISQNNITLNKLQSEIKILNREYEELIFYAYKTKDTRSKAAYLFSSDNFHQAYKRFIYLQFFTGYVEQTTSVLNNKKDSLSLITAELNESKLNKLKLKEKESDQLITLNNNYAEYQRIVKTLKYKKSSLEADYKTKLLAARTLKNSLNTQINETENEQKSQFSINFEAEKGKFDFPVNGVIISEFGVHRHPVLDNVQIINDGIEISVNADSDVKAVHKGVVSKIVSIPGAKNAVILKHGEYFTVYSNLSSVNVKTGQIIYKNDVLGRILYKNNPENAYLNFQIWYKRTKLNPQDWLK